MAEVKAVVAWPFTAIPASRPIPVDDHVVRAIEIGDLVRLVDIDLLGGHMIVKVINKPQKSIHTSYLEVEPITGTLKHWDNTVLMPNEPVLLIDIPELDADVPDDGT